MYNDDQNASPVNHVPTVVVLVSMAIAAVELVLQVGENGLAGGPAAVGWRAVAVNDYGFFAQIVTYMLNNDVILWSELHRFVTYPFIHGSFGHVLFGFVLVLAIGKLIAEAFSQVAFLVIFFASTIMGALVFGLIVKDGAPLVGTYPAAYGLIGALTFVLWRKARAEGSNQFRAFTLIGALLAIQAYFGLLYGGGYVWIADFTGFVTGFLLSFVLAPDGGARIHGWLDTIRKRR